MEILLMWPLTSACSVLSNFFIMDTHYTSNQLR